MIKRNQGYLNSVSAMIEFLLIFFSYVASTYIRFDVMYGTAPNLSIAWNDQYFMAALLYTVMIVGLYAIFGLYATTRSTAFKTIMFKVITINAFGVYAIATALYFTRVADFSRIAIAIFFVLSNTLILIKRWIVMKIMAELRRQGWNLKHVVVVGDGLLARQYIEEVHQNDHLGFCVEGYVSAVEKEGLGKRLCNYEELDTWLSKQKIDQVIIALEPHECEFVTPAIDACEKQGIKASIIPFFHSRFPSKPTIDAIGKSKMINLRATPLDDAINAGMKRCFDVVFSLFVLVLTSPLLLMVAIGIKITSPGPIIFQQTRVGYGKRTFQMYKFRSMRVNDRQQSGWSQKVDARKTKFGSLLRKTSIDELPQFVNVLKGDMSVIGPRPEVPFFVEQFKETIPRYMLKHQSRPGITGWAQVNGYRGDTSIEKRVQCDLWYIENWSMRLDAKIFVKTILGGMINDEKLQSSKDAR